MITQLMIRNVTDIGRALRQSNSENLCKQVVKIQLTYLIARL